MSAQGSQEELQSLDELLRDLSIDLESDDFTDLRDRLKALNRIEQELGALRSQLGYQVIRGSGTIEELSQVHPVDDEPEIGPSDYMVRRDNVELLIELQWDDYDGFRLEQNSLLRMQALLSSSSKSEEVIAVWPSKDLDSISLGPAQIYTYLAHAAEDVPVHLNEDQLSHLRENIERAFARYRKILHKPAHPDIGRAADFDLISAFSQHLALEVDELRDSERRRKLPERRIAISSLNDQDLNSVEMLFVDAISKDLDSEEVGRRLEAIFDSLEVDDLSNLEE